MKTRGYKMPASLLETTTDPRKRPGSLEATHLPACDGGPWPGIDPSDILSRQKLEFLAVYSHLNRLYDYMNVLRGSGSREEKQVVAALQRVIAFRDQLEDRYAPTGFYAEPVLKGHLTVNLVFHYAQKYVQENHRRHEPLEAWVKVPLPESKMRKALAGIPGISVKKIRADLNLRRPRKNKDRQSGD